MNKTVSIRLLVFIFFTLVSSLLPLVSFDGYSIIANTTSHLGAQGSPYAWVMNLVFISLGLTSFIILYKTNIRYHQVIGSVFSISLILTGLFRHESLIEGYQSVIIYDYLHSIFATTTGISFVLLAFGHGFMSTYKQRLFGFALATIATLISLLMMLLPDYIGLLQRLIFMSAFSWIFFYMKSPESKQFESNE